MQDRALWSIPYSPVEGVTFSCGSAIDLMSGSISVLRGWLSSGTGCRGDDQLPSLSLFERLLDNAFNNLLQTGEPWKGQAVGLGICRSHALGAVLRTLANIAHDLFSTSLFLTGVPRNEIPPACKVS